MGFWRSRNKGRWNMINRNKWLAVMLVLLFVSSSFTGALTNTVAAGYSGNTAMTVVDGNQADSDPEQRRHDVDYNYDYEGEGESAAISSKSTTRTVKSPFTKSTYRHASRFSGYQIANGIDVSQWQGNIDWKKVKKSGVEFAIIRVGYRGSSSGALRADSRYLSYIKGALKAGIKVGVYIYSQATSPAEAKAEANFVLKRIQGYDISMPVVLDYEFYTSSSGRLYKAHLSKREATDVCKAFCRTVENAGYTPMVYGNCDMMNNHLYAEELAQDYLMWLANFGKNNGTDRGFATTYIGTYSFWQYTSRGRVPGIGGYVDCNFWYKTSEIAKAKVATGISITDSNVTLTTNNMLYLYHSLSPAGCVDDIKWSSSRPAVAYVKDGYVYGVSGGETVITATTSTGACDSCKVVVSENMNSYEIQCGSSFNYTGRELTPSVSVVSKNKQADTGSAKRETVLFAGPENSYSLVKSIKKKTRLTIYGTKNKYYAVSVKAGGQTYYGYCLKKDVTATKAYKTLVMDRDYTVKYSENRNAGSALVEVTGSEQGIYSGTISKIFTIKPAAISDVQVGQITDQSIVGTAVAPNLYVSYNGTILKEGTDYKVTYQNNQANADQTLGTATAANATATITGLQNFTGTTAVNFAVGDSQVAFVDDIPVQEYTGGAITPELVVHGRDGSVLKAGVDYIISYSDNVNIGSGKAVISLTGVYSGVYQVYFPIVERDIAKADMRVSGTYTYNQKQQECQLQVTYQGAVLKEGVDYSCEYQNNCCAGTATVRIVGMGCYKGSKETTYTILPEAIAKTDFASIGKQAYSVKAVTPALHIKNGTTTLLRGTDYTVSYKNNKELGKATAVVTGKGNYTGRKTLHFNVVKKKIGNCKISKIGNRKYSGKRIKPALTVRNNGQKLKKGRDYTISYGRNRKIGKATVTIKGKGKYSGRKTVSFRIVR